MKLHKFIGNALLITVLPFVFVLVSSVLVSATVALIGTLVGHNTFFNCFQGVMETGIIIFMMSVVAIVGTLFYLSQDQ